MRSIKNIFINHSNFFSIQIPPRNSLVGSLYGQSVAPSIPPRVSSPSIASTSGGSQISNLPQSNSTGSINQSTKAFLENEGAVQMRHKGREQRNPSGDLIDWSNGVDE